MSDGAWTDEERVSFVSPAESAPLHLPPLTTSDAAAFAADVAAGSERDAFVKAEGRVRELEARLAAVEVSVGHRLRSLMRSDG